MKENHNTISKKKCYIINFVILFLDIAMVIYCAKKNKVHYVKFIGDTFLVGHTKDMLLGKNYVNVVITLFFYFYYLIIERFYMKNKLSKKKIFGCLLLLLLINLILFYCFTVRVY